MKTAPASTKIIKLYFDANYVCLGGCADEWWMPNYSGEYYHTNSARLPYGSNPVGKKESYFLTICRQYILISKPAGITPVAKVTATAN